MTIEGTPKTKEYWDTSHYNHRRDRLADVIGEYINDESTDSDQCYRDIISEVDGWISYYRDFLDKSINLKSKLMGHRPVDFIPDPSLDSITGKPVDKIFIQE